MTESPCSAFEASSRSPSFLICLLSHVSICQLYLYGFTVCVLARLVLWCLIACYDFTFLSFSPHDSLILSLSLSICFLLLQSFIYSASRAFAPQPGPLLTDSVWFYNAHARKKLLCSASQLLQLTLTVSFCLSPSFDVHSAHVYACTHDPILHKLHKQQHFVIEFVTPS